MVNASDEERAEAIDELKDKYKEWKADAAEYFEEKYAQEMDAMKKDKSYRR